MVGKEEGGVLARAHANMAVDRVRDSRDKTFRQPVVARSRKKAVPRPTAPEETRNARHHTLPPLTSRYSCWPALWQD